MNASPLTVVARPIMVDRGTAAALFQIAPSTFSSRVRDGVIPQPRQIGGNSRWLVADLEAAAARLQESSGAVLGHTPRHPTLAEYEVAGRGPERMHRAVAVRNWRTYAKCYGVT